jgi:tetratricopeptide (TPR) repeat protein
MMGDSETLAELLKEGLASRYRIERELGRGGMATVFLARDLTHDRPVAIKVLHPEIAAGVSTERFLREIHLLAALQHPHILPLHDSGAVNGIPYFVMPFVAGESLRDRLTRDRVLPLPLALRMISEAAAALDYAHRQGIVHRDIKPENILLSDDHVIVADFGIARAAEQSVDQRITATSVAIGTPAYMSPEQAMGDVRVDGRSDIYSLACVLFETIAGQGPFGGETPVMMIASRFSHPAPRVSTMAQGVPKSIEAAIASALSISPEDRPRSAAEFSAMLSGEPVSGKGGTRYRGIAIAAGSLALAAVLAAILFFRNDAPPEARPAPSAIAIGNPAPQRTMIHTVNREARELYRQGRVSIQAPSALGIQKAGEFFQAALNRDSLYAEAWAGLADYHASVGIGNYVPAPPRPAFEQAKFAALRALELDSTLAEAYAALAIVQMMYNYDWAGAARSLDRAESADPGYENTYLYRSFLLSWQGKFDSATVVSREALHMKPEALRIRQNIGRTLIQSHHFDEAERELRAAIVFEPTNGRLKMLLGETLLAAGRVGEGVKALDQAQKEAAAATRIAAFRVGAYAKSGRARGAKALVDSLIAQSDKSFVPALDIAIAWAGIGNRDQALNWLELGYNDRTLRPFIRDPVFDFVKSDPRYRALLAKMNLQP